MATRPDVDGISIKRPTMKSPGEGRSDEMCGHDWDIQVEIRAPYKTVDKHVNVLPIAFHLFEAFSDDPDKAIPILVKDDFEAALLEAIDGADELLENYEESGYMDAKNYTAINTMIKRARAYTSFAMKLKNFWRDSYNPDPGKGPRGWPLEQNLPGNDCDNKSAPETGEIFTLTEGGPGSVTFVCPTDHDKENHESDRQVFKDLLEAAMLNARCAQEAAAAVGTYYRNKEEYESRPGSGMAIQYGPRPTEGMPKLKVVEPPIPPTEPEERPPIIEPDAEPEPTAPTKKKKDNTLLIAGAAALGLMMLRK